EEFIFKMKTVYWSLFLCSLVVIILKPAEVDSVINCHVCNSNYNASCATVSKSSTDYLEACLPGEQLCRLVVQTVDDITQRTIRECAETGSLGCKRVASTISDLEGITCHCNTDGCNNAPYMNANLTAIVTAFVMCIIATRLHH
ncbi:unnamed protein product, partial [Owenia fusiformis]